MSQVSTTDTRIYIETPEGADLPLDPAGVGPRMVAHLVDWVIKAAVFFVLFLILIFVFGWSSADFGIGLFFIVLFLIVWFYPVYFEVWRNGATPGKKYAGILVVNDDGTPVTFAGSLTRNLLRFVDAFTVVVFLWGMPVAGGYSVGFISAISNARFKRLGDLAAGTIVIYSHVENPKPTIDVNGKHPIPGFFTTDDQRAVLAFAERSKALSLDRQQELADVLKPVLKEQDTVKVLHQMANTLVGRSGKTEKGKNL